MKVPIIKFKECKWFGPRRFTLTIFPFIIFKKEYVELVSEPFLELDINYESIRIQQQKELLVIPYFIWFNVEYCIKFVFYGIDAYDNVSFIREAFTHESDKEYLKNRKFWAFLKYL